MVVKEADSLPYSYVPLPNGHGRSSSDKLLPTDVDDRSRRRRQARITFAVLSFVAVVALAAALVGMKDEGEGEGEGNSKIIMSRGKAEGVSEKMNNRVANGWRLRGADPSVNNGLVFDWKDDMLDWQRTAFHFQPKNNWMNDPNGPLLYKGWYHFFYQYNPNAAVWGDIIWAHAASRDLINWLHLPIAMVADQWYDQNGVWTGSATFLKSSDEEDDDDDDDDDSTDDNKKLVMLYTGSTNESVQVQNLAYPADPSDPLLVDWVKYPGNPVLFPPKGIHSKDFRDPTTAFLTKDRKWRFMIGSKKNRTGISLVYDTTDFKNYELLETELHGVQGTGMWECVDFYPVLLSGNNGVDTSANGPSVKHVLKASMDDDRMDYYAIGTYDEEKGTWVPDDESLDVGIGLKYDYGGKFYASKTFYDDQKKRRILWGWMPEGDSEYADVQKGWASLQAIPRTVLYDNKTGSNLIQWPVEEVESLRTNVHTVENLTVEAGSVVPLNLSSATQMDIVAEFDIDPEALQKLPAVNSHEHYNCSGLYAGAAHRGTLGPFGLLVLAKEDMTEHTPVYFYVVKASHDNFTTFFCTDLTRSSVAPDVVKDVYGSTVPVLKGEKLTMRILVDHSIVETFAQEGRTCVTSRVYPTTAIYKDAKLFVFNNATDTTVKASIKAWEMAPASMLSASPPLFRINNLSLTFLLSLLFYLFAHPY